MYISIILLIHIIFTTAPLLLMDSAVVVDVEKTVTRHKCHIEAHCKGHIEITEEPNVVCEVSAFTLL